MKKKSIFIIIGSVLLIGGVVAGVFLINPKPKTTQTETTQPETTQTVTPENTTEITESSNQEQGIPFVWDWETLAKTQSYPEFREKFDALLGITISEENSKNGVLFVDLEGNHIDDSTLYYAFQNQDFIDNVWNNTDIINAIIALSKETYSDVESERDALIAAFNSYYNLVLDNIQGTAALDNSVTRIDAMAAVHKADTPINNILDFLNYDEHFDETIGYHEYSTFAQELVSQNYLDYKDKGLNEETANSAITKAEYIYLLVQRYYPDEYEKITGEETCYNDCKNGGNIALNKGFITQDSNTGEIVYPDGWQWQELSYTLDNTEAGMPENLYKAMIVAQNHNWIEGDKSYWNESLTKREAIDFLFKVYEDPDVTIHEDRNFSMIAKDVTMYATGTVNVRKGPSADFEKIGSLTTNQAVHVTGQSDSSNWYEIEFNGTKGYVSNDYLSDVSPYISDRNGYTVGCSLPLTDGTTIIYQGNDIWIDPSLNMSYKVMTELGDGRLNFQLIGGDSNSPYMSDRNGYAVGYSTTLDNGITITYQGNDVWIDYATNTTYIATKELGGGRLSFQPQVPETNVTPSDPSHDAEDLGYKIGDTLTKYGSNGKRYDFVYQGNDVWITADGVRAYSSNNNGQLSLSLGIW